MRCAWLNIFMFIPISLSHAGAAGSLFRSDVKFERVSVDQGLSNITVSCIAQDKHGFLWIGTEDGLNRYDGYTFTVFRPSEEDSLSLPGSIITRVYCDRRGTLWAGVIGRGICRYDERRNGFIRYSGATNESGQPAWANVSWIFEDREDSLWLCTNNGLWRYDAQSDTFVQLVLTSDAGRVMTGTGIRTLQIDRDGRWWVGTHSEGLFSYDPGTDLTLRYTSAQDKQFAPIEKEIIALCADRRDGVWIATLRGAYRLDIRTGKLQDFARYFSQPVHLTNGIVLDIREDSRGDVWIGTFHGGLFRYIPAADTFFNYRHDPDDPRSIVSNRIEHMYEDVTGSLWFASYRDGLNKYTPVTGAFFRFKEATPRRPGINGQAVYAIAQDSLGRLLFGTNEQGLTVCDPSTGSYSSYPAADAPRYGTMAICVDREGNVWAGEGATLKKHDRRAKRFVNVPLRTQDRLALNAEVKCLMQDHAGFIWVGMNEGGLFRVDPRTGASEHFRHSERDSTSLPWPAVWCVFEDSKNRLWVGTFGGGFGLFDRASQRFTRYRQREGDTTSLGSNLVYSITEDTQGYLWVGTFAGGLNRFDPTTGTFQRYTQRDGLPNNFVKVALTDRNGLLWISSDRGISRYDPKAHTFTNYTTTDGLHGNVFLSGAYCRTRDGMFIFGGMSGATAFYPDSVRTISVPPPVVITSFQLYDQPYPLEQPAYAAQSVALSHDQNFLAFEFSALDFTASSRNRYRYKLEGLDTGWVEAGTQRLARYTHIPPGTYTFRVIGSNKDGVWNERGASLAITIAPPFWGTWWFRVTALAAVIAVGIGLYNYRVNRLLEIERLRVRIASDLHDDIGSSLTKISLQSELIQEGIEPSEIPTYLKNIATMSRDLVTAMSDIVWSIDARNDTIENLIEKMKSFGGGTLSAKDIRFQLAYSGLDLKKKIPVDVRENLYLIFKEAINNIAKHAAASNVNVTLRNDADGFRMFIVDDGIGWEGTRKPTGHGTRNMKMRAERLGGSIDFVRDEGTRVVLALKKL